MANTSVLMTELQRLRTGLEEEQAEKNRKKVVTFEEYINKVFDWPIPHFWLEPVRAMPKNKKLLILVPPGHRKTTTLVAYAAWALGTKYRTRIVIVSHTADYASTILNQVTDVLQSERSIQLIGKVVPDNPSYTAPLWRVDKRKIYHNAMQKEPNLISVGIEGSALGYRVDAIICCLPGTKVVSATGLVGIEDAETAATHSNAVRTVTRRFEREYAGDIYSVKVQGWPEALRVTPEHPLYVVRRQRCSQKRGTAINCWCKPDCKHSRKGNVSCEEYYKEYVPEFVPARLVDDNYYAVFPRHIDVEPGIIIPRKYGNFKDRTFDYRSEDFWYLVGLYLADGSVGSNKVVFYLNAKTEESLADLVIEKAKRVFGCSGSKTYSQKNTIAVHIYNTQFSDFVKQFGRNAASKFVPLPLMNWLDEKCAKGLLQGYMDGDGCQNGTRAVSSSMDMVWSLRQLAFRFGWPASICNCSPRSKSTGFKSDGSKWEFRLAQWVLNDKEIEKSRMWFDDKYAYLPIVSVEKSEYSGPVYNLEVAEDNTYATPQILTHNCDDIITPKNSYTPTMRAKISAAFWAELSKRLEPDGQIIISGSRFYKNDLYDEISNNPDWEKITLTSTPENILWPERFSKEQLEQERSANELFFRSQYLQEPISDGTALDGSWLNYYIEAPPNLAYYIGVDPCEKAKEGTDFFAACVLGVSPDGIGHIIDIVEAQLSLNQQVEMVQRLSAMYKPTLVNVEEKGALYGMLADNLKWYVRASPSNLPKHIRMQNIAEKFRQKKLLLKGVIDEGELIPDIMSQKFRQQWESFGGSGHDDILDATEKAYEAYLQGGESATSFVSIADDIVGEEKGDTTYARTRPYVSVHDYNPFNIQRLF